MGSVAVIGRDRGSVCSATAARVVTGRAGQERGRRLAAGPRGTAPTAGRSSTSGIRLHPDRSTAHHSSCFTTPRGPAELTTAQAVEALRRPGAVACEVCGADRLGGRWLPGKS
ncbi:DUF6233 domain-containing protein [Streptomyces syringium]|uniref:DUF6233 domain-containing protein n=1 Tax=Streptomyces syringium TaxID=76729 RepID=UPI00339F7CBD